MFGESPNRTEPYDVRRYSVMPNVLVTEPVVRRNGLTAGTRKRVSGTKDHDCSRASMPSKESMV